MKQSFWKRWWDALRFEPGDPRLLAGGAIKIAVIGGGTGLSVLLRGLKNYSNDISAIVAVTDDGSSSGIIRKEFDILPPGDIRKCISALAYDEKMISHIMEYRFDERRKPFSGHTLGNIWITALSKYLGSFERAIEVTTEIFDTAGRILPATLDNVRIGAIYKNGKKVVGESLIPKPRKKIERVYLNKGNVRAYSESVKAIAAADLIVLGPGSLYTSIIPNLLITGIKNAVKNNQKAVKVYIVNSSTERGETESYSVNDHIQAVINHAGNLFRYALVNSRIIKRSKDESALGKINNITTEEDEILGLKVVKADVIAEENPLYHDGAKLAKNLIKIYNDTKRRPTRT